MIRKARGNDHCDPSEIGDLPPTSELIARFVTLTHTTTAAAVAVTTQLWPRGRHPAILDYSTMEGLASIRGRDGSLPSPCVRFFIAGGGGSTVPCVRFYIAEEEAALYYPLSVFALI